MSTNETKFHHLWLFQLLIDLCAVVVSYYATFAFRFRSHLGQDFFTWINCGLGVRESAEIGDELALFYLNDAPRLLLFLIATICFLYALRDLYPGRRFIRPRPTTWHILSANTIALALFYCYFYLSRNTFHPRSFFATALILNTALTVVLRSALERLLTRMRSRHNIDQWRAIIIGRGTDADLITQILASSRPHGILPIAVIDLDPQAPFEHTLHLLERRTNELNADILIAAERNLPVPEIMQLLELADRMGTDAKILSLKLDVLTNQAGLPADWIQGAPLLHFASPHRKSARFRAFARRIITTSFAAFLLLLLAPLMGLIALAIRLTSKGPVFFVQERIGVSRRPFAMLKFRTMYDRATEIQAQLEEFNESSGPLFKIKRDPRITPIGRILRRFSLDELPQLVNVLRGDMTLVGPRPLPRRDFENYYEEWHYSRHAGLPGLTCLWQVSGRSELDFHNMCLLDVYYLRNRNWTLDLKICIKTLWVVAFAKGAY